MRVSDSRRLLFVHIPKTAGASVEKILDDNVPDVRWEEERHHRLDEILGAEPYLVDYWTFGFVRNPWARMVSWWSMLAVAAERGAPHDLRKFREYPLWAQVRDYCHDFDTFIVRGLDEVERLRTPQLDFLRAGEREADFIGRHESFAEDVTVLRDRLGLSLAEKVPHRHRGAKRDYRDVYTARTRDAVAEAYRADLDRFGYEF